jgi:protein SCO1/2
VPLDAVLRDEADQPVTLRDLVRGQPVILALGYFRCPNLCGIVRGDLLDALGRAASSRDYALVVLSIDPAEHGADADAAKQRDAAQAGVSPMPLDWHYLTGSADALRSVENAVGFRARFDPDVKQFLHPAGIVFLTPRGVVSSYLLGVGYSPDAVRDALQHARSGAIAGPTSAILLLCFHYDPATGRYTLAVTRVLQLAGVLTVATIGGTIALALRRERRH